MPAARFLTGRFEDWAGRQNTPGWVVRVQFSLRPKPLAHEFAPGYLIRVAEANGYETPLAFWRTLSRRYSVPSVGLRNALNLRVAELKQILGPFPAYTHIAHRETLGLRTEDFNHHWLRWCPLCWTDSLFLHFEWGIKLCCVCTRHQVILLDRCPQCGARQKYQRASLGRCCRCGSALADAATTAAPQSWIELAQILMAGLYPEEHLVPRQMSPADWVRFIKYFGQISLDPATRCPGQVVGLQDIEKATALVNAAAQVLADWPNGMHTLLSRLRATYPLSSHIGESFGALYRVLYAKLSVPCFDFLREAFEGYLHEHWFGLLGGRNRRLSGMTIATHPRKPAQVIADKAGTGRALVCHLANEGLIEGLAFYHPSGRSTWAIHEEESSTIAGYISDSITVVQASTLLGINRSRVRELISEKVLDTRISRESAYASTWLLSRSSVESVLRLGGVLPQLEDAVSTICLGQILKYWQLHKGEFAALLRAIAGKQVCSLGRLPGFSGIAGLALPTDEARRWLDLHRTGTQHWFSIEAAARQLNVKQQVAYQLVKSGLLKASSTDFSNGRHCPVQVHSDAIEAFRGTYVALANVARAQHTSPKNMLRLLHVLPVTGPSVDGGRQYFFHRDDVVAELQHLTVKPGGD